jgi:hypothetical protein
LCAKPRQVRRVLTFPSSSILARSWRPRAHESLLIFLDPGFATKHTKFLSLVFDCLAPLARNRVTRSNFLPRASTNSATMRVTFSFCFTSHLMSQITHSWQRARMYGTYVSFTECDSVVPCSPNPQRRHYPFVLFSCDRPLPLRSSSSYPYPTPLNPQPHVRLNWPSLWLGFTAGTAKENSIC